MLLAVLSVLSIVGVGCLVALALILFSLQDAIARFDKPRDVQLDAPWPIIPESVRIDRVPAVQRKPRKPRAPKAAPPAEPAPERDTATLPLLSGDDAQKPTV
jgi:hypothetical protein